MQRWHYFICITLIFFFNSILHAAIGWPSALLLGATMLILVHPQSGALLKIYASCLVCFDYFIWLDQVGPPLIYLIPLGLLGPTLNQLLMPQARSLLPYIFFACAFFTQTLLLEPLVTGVFPSASYTFLPFCAIVGVMYITLKYYPPTLKPRRGTTP